jgi:hypothetical protein
MTSNEVKAINDLCEAVDKWDGNYSTLEGVERLEALYMKRLDWRDAGSPRVPEVPSAGAWQVAFCRAYILVNAMAGDKTVSPAMSQTCGLIAESMTKFMPGEGGEPLEVPSAEKLTTAVAILIVRAAVVREHGSADGSHKTIAQDLEAVAAWLAPMAGVDLRAMKGGA